MRTIIYSKSFAVQEYMFAIHGSVPLGRVMGPIARLPRGLARAEGERSSKGCMLRPIDWRHLNWCVAVCWPSAQFAGLAV